MNQKINPNLADAAELVSLPGIGPKLAERIIEARPFESLQDLEHVKGIGHANLGQWLEDLTLTQTTSPIPVDPARVEMPPVAADEILPGEEEEVFVEPPIMEELPQELADDILAENPSQSLALNVKDVEPETEPEKEVVQVEHAEKSTFNRDQVFLITGIGALLSFILAVALILGVIAGLNQGRLRFASPAEVRTLSSSMDLLSSRLTTQESDLLALRTRVDALETLNDRMTSAEDNINTLNENLNMMSEQVNNLEDEVSTLSTDVADLQKQTTLFTSFFESMRDLFTQFFPAEGGTNE